ncbi:MAG: serine/threonine-protein kinase, partial [Gemmatimonadota bacterium]|nr:serine/threonine-protein kinase [Gemmatimonadota bacterium]
MSPVADRLTTTLEGRYRIERELGAGGMATVYLAHDVKHDRKVALKVLRPELAAVIGAERFLKEIKLTANLQHANILPLYDSGSAAAPQAVGGQEFLYYVMPYIEGESLRQRLDRETQLPIDDALKLTGEVAAALDYAHRQGVIHRDIKPENVLLHDGQAFVADFGIALAVSEAGGSRMTETGMSLGTPHYMSPEQAMGDRELTPKSDVYALGAMLYEMLTGEPPFSGPTAQAIVAKVMTATPVAPTELRATVPDHVEAAVLRALQKLPADRWVSAAEFNAALQGAVATRAMPGHRAAPRASGPWRAVALGALAAAALLAVIAAWGWLRRSGPPAEVARFTLTTAPDASILVNQLSSAVAISPDARTFVWLGPGTPEQRLYTRRIDDLAVEVIPGTDGAYMPFFSPDGRWLGFAQGMQLRKVDLESGTTLTIGPLVMSAQFVSGAFWSEADTIYYSMETQGGLYKVSAAGGAPPTRLGVDSTRLYYWPSLAPGSRWLVTSATDPSRTGRGTDIVAISLESGAVRTVMSEVPWGMALTDEVMLARLADGSILGARWDANDPAMVTDRVPLLNNVQGTAQGVPHLAVSHNGMLFYLTGGSDRNTIVLADRGGRETVLLEEPRGYRDPRFSPDGRRLAYHRRESDATGHLWIYEIATGTQTRLTSESDNIYPVWTPDGRRIVFTSRRSGLAGLWWKASDGSSPAEELLAGSQIRFPGSVTPDGRTLLYREIAPRTGFDLYSLPLTGEHTPTPLLVTEFNESAPQLSPDGIGGEL